MEVLQSGKFDRRHARNIAGFLTGCTRLLDLDCGIGFVALRARAATPDLQVTIHEERPALLLMSRRIADLNVPDPTGIAWSQATPQPRRHLVRPSQAPRHGQARGSPTAHREAETAKAHRG